MAEHDKNNGGFELSPSYDIGVNFTFRNLLRDNPYRRRFFRQWIARFDHENIKNYYNYETGASRNKGSLASTEVNYDQIQKMIYSANLPVAIENELFYHLDYHLNRENKSIDFLKVKEFFSFCGIDGIYDLENKKHFLVPYDPPFVSSSLNVEKWNEKEFEENRELIARMMSEPGEVPNNKDIVQDLKLQYNLLWQDVFSGTELHDKLMDRMNSVYGNARGEEQVLAALEKAKAENIDLDEFDPEIEEFTRQFDKTAEAKSLLDQIRSLQEDEQRKLAAAMKKYADPEFLRNPDRFAEYDKNLGRYGLDWDYNMNHEMNDIKKWGKLYIGHDTHDTCSNEPPTQEELSRMKPKLVEKGLYSKARFQMMMQEFEHEVWPSIRDRYCAIKDWILRDYTMNPINKGEIAKARREDIPVLFQQALREELDDGLLTGLQFPIRVEALDDDSDKCMLVLNDHPVETFHPREVLPELQNAGHAPVTEHTAEPALQDYTPEEDYRDDSHHEPENYVDFKLHNPGHSFEPTLKIDNTPLSAHRDDDNRRDYLKRSSGGSYTPHDNPRARQYDRALTPKNNLRRHHHFDNRFGKGTGTAGRPPSTLVGPSPKPHNRLMRDPIQLPKGPNPFMPGNTNFKGFAIPIPTFSFGNKSHSREAGGDMEKAKQSLLAENAAGKPVSDETISKIKRAGEKAKEELAGIDNESILQKSKGYLSNLSKQARETMNALKDSLSKGTLGADVYKECMKMLKGLREVVQQLVVALGRLVGLGSGPAKA